MMFRSFVFAVYALFISSTLADVTSENDTLEKEPTGKSRGI